MAFYGMARFASRFAPRMARGLARRVPKMLRRRRPRMMRRKKTQNKVHTFVRWCDKDSLYPASNGPSTITETGVSQNLVYTFKLDNVVNPADFTNLYDKYKINKITLFLEPQDNLTSVGTVPSQKKICVVWDDDGNALTQEDDYLEYANCRRYNANSTRTIKLTLYPKVSIPMLNKDGGLTAFQTIPAKNWIKIEDDEVPHFGFKIFIPDGINVIGLPIFQVRAKYHLSLKNSK